MQGFVIGFADGVVLDGSRDKRHWTGALDRLVVEWPVGLFPAVV